MVFILVGCTRQLVWTPSFAVNVTVCHYTDLVALTESWLGVLCSETWAIILNVLKCALDDCLHVASDDVIPVKQWSTNVI